MATQQEQITARRRRRMILVLFACNLLASFMQSLMNIALDYVSEEYHVSLSEANLLVLGYSIVAGIVIVLAATSLRRFGLRKVMLFGLVVSFVGSLLGVLAWDFPSLVVARLIQAVATGLYFPVVNEALLNLSPKNGAGRLLAIDSGVIGVGLAVAPIISGLIITYWGLRVLFVIPMVAAFVLFFFTWRVLIDIMPRQKLSIDGMSVVLIAVGLSAFMVGLNDVARYPVPMAALMVVGIAVCAWFVHRQKHLAQPLLDMRPFRNKTYVLGETLIVLSYMSSIYLSLLIPLYLEGVSGFTPFIAGCLVAPAVLCYAGFCFVSGRVLGKSGVWPLVPIGFGVCLIGFVALAVFTRIDVAVAMVCCMALACAGIGTEYPAIKSVDLEVLPSELSTSGSSIHSTLVQVAGSVSSALFVGIMSGRVHRLMDGGATKIHAYSDGFTLTVYLAIAFVVLATVLSVIYARRVLKSNGGGSTTKNTEKHEKKALKDVFTVPRIALVVVLFSAVFMVAGTLVYLDYNHKTAYEERSQHMTEITLKVADQIDTVIDIGTKSTSIGGAYLQDETIDTTDALYEDLAYLSELSDEEGNAFVAFGESGMYYTSRYTSGKWIRNQMFNSAHESGYMITSFPDNPLNTYLVMYSPLPEPKVVAETSEKITHLAMAFNMKNVQEMLDVSSFDNSCMTYVISSDFKRIYSHTFGKHFIADYDVSNVLSSYDYMFGASSDQLLSDIKNGSTSCMEFMDSNGEYYFVCTTPIENDTLMLFVPTDVLAETQGSNMLNNLRYFTAMALALAAIVAMLVMVAMRNSNDSRIISQQKSVNAQLAAARDEAELASHAKTVFLSNMSHDIRTPMNAIIGFTTIAQEHIDDKSRVADCLNKISISSDHLLSLINDILDMSKMEHGKVELEITDCNLQRTLSDLFEIVESQAQTKKIAFEADASGIEDKNVLVDDLRLQQILMNVISNAIKYTPEGGRVEVRVEEQKGEDPNIATYVFTVSDTGIGIASDFIPELFSAFTRERNTTASKIQGTGLGLAITKNLVDMMGGSIGVRSEVGQGSEFVIALPLSLCKVCSVEGVSESLVSTPIDSEIHFDSLIEGMRVLLAEDNDLNAMIVIGMLEDPGVKIDWVKNGEEALCAVRDNAAGTYEAILMDAQMPVMNGYEATSAIRNLDDDNKANIPIVALTANAFDEDKKRAFDSGMNAHLSKPVSVHELKRILAQIRSNGNAGDNNGREQ